MLRVIFDFHSVLLERHSGFFTYGAGLLAGFAELADRPDFTLLVDGRSGGNGDWLGDLPVRLGCRWAKLPGKARHWEDVWRWMGWPSLRRLAGDGEIYHCNHHLMPPTKAKRVMTVHDLRRYRYPQLYEHSKLGRFERAIAAADHFIAISESTKKDLQEFFGVADEKVDVVYHGGPLLGGDESRVVDEELLAKWGLVDGRYWLTFSSYDKRKNIGGCLRAFEAAVGRLDDDYKLVVVGKLPSDAEEMLGAMDGKVRERVVCVGPVDDVFSFLAGARGFLNLSYYEGFGLPLVEAMAAGAAVIASDRSSLPEVVGDAGLLVGPDEAEEVAEAMVKLSDDDDLHGRLVEVGKGRCKEFSWRRAAEETLAVYKKLIMRD